MTSAVAWLGLHGGCLLGSFAGGAAVAWVSFLMGLRAGRLTKADDRWTGARS